MGDDYEQDKVLAERTEQIRSYFISNMSHELRTPLNAILGFVQLLEMNTEGIMNKSNSKYIFEIRRAGQHVLKILDSNLNKPVFESNDHELFWEDVYLVDSARGKTEDSPGVQI